MYDLQTIKRMNDEWSEKELRKKREDIKAFNKIMERAAKQLEETKLISTPKGK